jgi:predicted PurR-regulated permease PerM
MEVFIPGLCLFLIAIAISFAIIPRFTPLMIAIVSIIVLVIAVWQHYSMFRDDYRLSTWQESFKVYAPAMMIVAMILFIIYFILSVFTNGAVPIPSMPSLPTASPNSATSQVMSSLGSVANSIGSISSNVRSSVNNMFSQPRSQNTSMGNRGKQGNNLSRSFLETL